MTRMLKPAWVVTAYMHTDVPSVKQYMSPGLTQAGNLIVLQYGRRHVLRKSVGMTFLTDVVQMRKYVKSLLEHKQHLLTSQLQHVTAALLAIEDGTIAVRIVSPDEIIPAGGPKLDDD